MGCCEEHPEEEALYVCDSCGKEFCERCVEEMGYDTVICPECELLVADLNGVI
jgi:DNA-directed RNA polymerase subunit RPC12/RpoP